MLGLLLTFLFGGVALYGLVDKQIERTMENQIKNDFKDVESNAKVYIKQILILNYVNNDEESFKEVSSEILSELYSAGKREVALYDLRGNLLCESRDQLFSESTTTEDLEKAMKKKSAFTMIYTEEDGLFVYFSMPAYVEESNVGIVRYYVDYSSLRQDGIETRGMVIRVTIFIFLMIFIIILLLINTFVHPVQKLAKISNQVTMDLAKNEFDGSYYRELKSQKRQDEVGELNHNYGIMLRTVEEQLNSLQKDKEQIYQLMKSRKEFYDNVTHELKTPLTTISGYAQLLETNGVEDKELFEKGIKNIMSESVRLHKMVIQLLEMGEYEQNQEMGSCLLESIVLNVAEMMEVKANRYQTHIDAKAEDGMLILGQTERIRQVLINLIDNAIKYGKKKETIVVRGTVDEEKVLITVTNKGKGLTKQEIKHIFEPFYRVDKQLSREQGSSGLGLSICEEIMKQHNGMIRVSSIENEETTFTLQFPKQVVKEDVE